MALLEWSAGAGTDWVGIPQALGVSLLLEQIPLLKKLGNALLHMIRYLELNADSMPDYGKRYRNGSRISTGFAESAVNEIIAKRMTKKQQMRWNRYTVQQFLNVRVHVLDETLEDAFRYWHQGFRPVSATSQITAAAA